MTHVHRQQAPTTLGDRRVAVTVIDVQNDYCHPDGVFARAGLRVADPDALVAAVNRLTSAARAAGHHVVWVRMVWDGDADVGRLGERSPFLAREGLRRGTWGAELVDGLDVSPADHLIEKKRFSGFYETGLEELLRGLGVTTLVAAGVRTDFCVESTVRDAMFRDFEVLVPREAVAGYFPALHEGSLALMGTVFAWVLPVDQVLGLFARSSDLSSVQEV